MRRFRISSHEIVDDHVQLRGAEFHHLRHVLRLDVGTRIGLYDERGTTYSGKIIQIASESAELAITQIDLQSPSSFHSTLAQSVLKGPKMDLVIEKATELGVSSIAPFHSAHTVARIPEAKQIDRVERWQRIAQAAAKQSGSLPPEIYPPRSFSGLLHSAPQSAGRILFSEHEQSVHFKDYAKNSPTLDSLYMFVGPEGGFSPKEVELALASGFTSISLGPSILRAETASIAAIALCQFLWRERQFPPLP